MNEQDAIRRMRDFYAHKPGAPLYRREFGFYVLDKWIAEGWLSPRGAVSDYDAYLRGVFGYDEPVFHAIGGLGFCESAMLPAYEKAVLSEDRGYEYIRDEAGRTLKCFRGRRSGFMPEYVAHPVYDRRSWEEDVRWRLDPSTPARYTQAARDAAHAREEQLRGHAVVQQLIGGYMYLRSLIGPEHLLYAFYDMPDVVEDCMEAWLQLSDAVIAKHQETVTFDELFFGEDICYNHGCLISPDMANRFLFPYYQQLIQSVRRRNGGRTLHIHIDTDGFADPVLDAYRALGADCFSPFEVAAGCDVVRTGAQYPDLLMRGGIDKRVLASGRDAIDRHLDAILPVMRKRGGYIPTCDHGVPEEVPFEDYLYYRARMAEYCG